MIFGNIYIIIYINKLNNTRLATVKCHKIAISLMLAIVLVGPIITVLVFVVVLAKVSCMYLRCS